MNICQTINTPKLIVAKWMEGNISSQASLFVTDRAYNKVWAPVYYATVHVAFSVQRGVVQWK